MASLKKPDSPLRQLELSFKSFIRDDDPTKSADGSPSRALPYYSTMNSVKDKFPVDQVYDIVPQNRRGCLIYNEEFYKEMYQKSIKEKGLFWRELALSNLRWSSTFSKTQESDISKGHFAWFLNGKLNVCDNCVDRWAESQPTKVAVIYEGDNPQDVERITYAQLKINVCKFANMLLHLGVKRHDIVVFYMPMFPPLIYGMLACARIGAVHAVVFGGFSAPNLRDRLNSLKAKIIITADQGLRGGKCIPMKKVVDEALSETPLVEKCVVFRRAGQPVAWVEKRDVHGNELVQQMRPYCPCVAVDSEDPLFIIHTSSSHGTSHGACHSSAGYLLFAAVTNKYVFDYRPGDVFACVADIGWITGHSYLVYGPLCNGGTTVLFESIPTFPDAGRYWAMVEKHKVTSFYTAPTALRTLMRFGDEFPKKYDMSSLRILGTVGEKINQAEWEWYYNVIGNKACSVVDTYWQTETGGHMITTFPGAHKSKPGCAGVPFFGVEVAILDPRTGKELYQPEALGVLCFKNNWPGIMRTAFGSHTHFLREYLDPFPGYFFTGDGAYRDKDGFYWITGRVDETMNIAGHRFASAQFEIALASHEYVTECAAFAIPHKIKGSGVICFAELKRKAVVSKDLQLELKSTVRHLIGPVATPDFIVLADRLPKYFNGELARDCLRKIASMEDITYCEGLVDCPEVLTGLQEQVKEFSESLK